MVQQRSSHLRHLKGVESAGNLPYQSPISLTGAMDLLQMQNWAAVVREGKTTHYRLEILKQMGVEGTPVKGQVGGSKRAGRAAGSDPEQKHGGNCRDCLFRTGLRPEHAEAIGPTVVKGTSLPREKFSLLRRLIALDQTRSIIEGELYYKTWDFFSGGGTPSISIFPQTSSPSI
jgi:hypothetical protein